MCCFLFKPFVFTKVWPPSTLCNVLCTTKRPSAIIHIYNCAIVDVLWALLNEQCKRLHNATLNSSTSIEQSIKYDYTGCGIVQHCVHFSTIVLCWHIAIDTLTLYFMRAEQKGRPKFDKVTSYSACSQLRILEDLERELTFNFQFFCPKVHICNTNL